MSMSPKTMQSHLSPLEALPAEIQLWIGKLVLGYRSITEVNSYAAGKTGLSKDLKKIKRTRLHAGVLRTCSTLRHRLLPAFLEGTAFDIPSHQIRSWSESHSHLLAPPNNYKITIVVDGQYAMIRPLNTCAELAQRLEQDMFGQLRHPPVCYVKTQLAFAGQGFRSYYVTHDAYGRIYRLRKDPGPRSYLVAVDEAEGKRLWETHGNHNGLFHCCQAAYKDLDELNSRPCDGTGRSPHLR